MADFTSLLTSSHLDIKVPLVPLPPSSSLSQILSANSRRSLFFDESVSLFLVFRLAAEAADETRLHEFLKEIVLNLEVAITDTPRQSDPTTKREKFEGAVVYAASIPDTADRTIEQADGQWYVAWNVVVPIKHGRTRIPNPRVALTAILSLNPISLEPEEPKDEIITADSWKFLAGQTNLLSSLATDPNITTPPVLPLSRIVSSGPQQSTRTKPGRRICRHIFPCGSPLDIRMRYNPLEPDDNTVSKEAVLLSVDLSVTPHAGASVLVQDIKVEMDGGSVLPLQDMESTVLRRHDVLTLLFRYVRYGGEGGRKTVSTSATMIPLLSGSPDDCPQIVSLWNKSLDIPSLASQPAPLPRPVSQLISPASTTARQSPKPSPARPRSIVATTARIQSISDLQSPKRPLSTSAQSIVSTAESPYLSITVKVPSKGVKPNEKFPVQVQVVNRATRPIKLVLQVDSGQSRFQTQVTNTKIDKLLPRVPLTSNPNPMTEATSRPGNPETDARELFFRAHERRKGKPFIALTVEHKLGVIMPGQVQSVQAEFQALSPGIHEITSLRLVEIPTQDTPPTTQILINLTSAPSIVVHGDRY